MAARCNAPLFQRLRRLRSRHALLPWPWLVSHPHPNLQPLPKRPHPAALRRRRPGDRRIRRRKTRRQAHRRLRRIRLRHHRSSSHPTSGSSDSCTLRQLPRSRPDALRLQRLQPLRRNVPARKSGLRPSGLARDSAHTNKASLAHRPGGDRSPRHPLQPRRHSRSPRYHC